MHRAFSQLKTTSELIVYRSAYGHDCCVPGKQTCANFLYRISLGSEIIFLGIKKIESEYDLFSWEGKEFITPLGALMQN